MFPERLKEIANLLPKYEDIEKFLQDESEAAYILKLAVDNIRDIQLSPQKSDLLTSRAEESSYLIHSLVDKCWERIHTGHFSEVPLVTRQIYALACYFKIFFLLSENVSIDQVEKCSVVLDEAMLIGCTHNLYEQNDILKHELAEYLNGLLVDSLDDIKLPVIAPLKRHQYVCDVPQMNCPSIEVFQKQCFEAMQPALLLNTIGHWPALEKWRNLNYLLKIAGNRTVPIEIGSHYATEDWSQQLVKIRDFLTRQFNIKSKPCTEIEYLAQHDLFDQIPDLKADIRVPDYSVLGAHTTPVDIKAWLGPKGTISPMHYDQKHNLLCQVFGAKKVILAAPKDTPNLYPHLTEFLCNTSQIDAGKLDLEQFPLVSSVKFYQLTLQEGDCLYIPSRWWHYVRSESESFSVSFWWE